jgi:predicted NUDIX family phosphoesterase
MTQTSAAKPLQPSKYNEQILVVKRSCLFPGESWNGLNRVNFDAYLSIIQEQCEFHPRGPMEDDPTYKQIIPYLVFTHEGRYFLMERHAKASEQRLKSKLSLGIGGHIRKEDMGEGKGIFDWARREFHEEVNYQGHLTIKPLGILNDDSNEVGKVHIGFVFLLEGDSPEISVKSELQSGHLTPLEDLITSKDRMETWSQLVVEFLG